MGKLSSQTVSKVLIATAIGFFVAIIIVAQLVAEGDYNWTVNTISQLAAQGYDKSWIMQFGFIVYGLVLFAGLYLKKPRLYADKFIMIYALSVVVAGVFRTEPILNTIDYSVVEQSIHGFIAGVGGTTMCAGVFAYAWSAKSTAAKLMHWRYLIAAITLIAMYGLAKRGHVAVGRGLIQRILFITSFMWLYRTYLWQKAETGLS